MYNNIFEDIFGEALSFKTPETYEEELNENWQRGKIDLYYKLLNDCKKQFKVYRDSNGNHKVKKKE